jgi:putative transposase
MVMPNYRRYFREGGTYFFTVKTFGRQQLLCTDAARSILRAAIDRVRINHPFEIIAWVLLPDHLHTIWKLPENDCHFSRRCYHPPMEYLICRM